MRLSAPLGLAGVQSPPHHCEGLQQVPPHPDDVPGRQEEAVVPGLVPLRQLQREAVRDTLHKVKEVGCCSVGLVICRPLPSSRRS